MVAISCTLRLSPLVRTPSTIYSGLGWCKEESPRMIMVRTGVGTARRFNNLHARYPALQCLGNIGDRHAPDGPRLLRSLPRRLHPACAGCRNQPPLLIQRLDSAARSTMFTRLFAENGNFPLFRTLHKTLTRVFTPVGTSISNFPETLEVALFFAFFAIIVAPVKGAPFSSVMVPVTDLVWA